MSLMCLTSNEPYHSNKRKRTSKGHTNKKLAHYLFIVSSVISYCIFGVCIEMRLSTSSPDVSPLRCGLSCPG